MLNYIAGIKEAESLYTIAGLSPLQLAAEYSELREMIFFCWYL